MTESHEKKDGSCCQSTRSHCCGSKKIFMGILMGVAIAVIAHCFVCGQGSMCGKAKMCPIMPSSAPQVPAQ